MLFYMKHDFLGSEALKCCYVISLFRFEMVWYFEPVLLVCFYLKTKSFHRSIRKICYPYELGDMLGTFKLADDLSIYFGCLLKCLASNMDNVGTESNFETTYLYYLFPIILFHQFT